MPDQAHEPTTQALNDLAVVDPRGSAQTIKDEVISPDRHLTKFIDWLTLDMATLEGETSLIEEFRFYQENLEELLRSHEGQYVLIIGREIIAYFEDLESAGEYVEQNVHRRSVLVKKVARFEPIATFG